MRRPSHTLLLVAVALVCGCGLPRAPIKQTLDRRTTLETNGRRIHVYQARDPRTLDSSSRMLRAEYQPVHVYAVVDDRDSVEQTIVAAWMELLWRFSERLSPTDKDYFAPLPLAMLRSGDSMIVTWGYPDVDTRDDDLKYVTPYRNSYWSVDVFTSAQSRTEIFRGDIRSYPQYEPYDPLKRFARGGAFDRAFGDTANVYAALRRYLETPVADRDTTGR